jgi:Domain of unknown function (DUF4430)
MSVTVFVTGGPSTSVPWKAQMTAQDALEAAWQLLNPVPSAPPIFTYALQYYGSMGYLVIMINETYETYSSKATPNFYWEFYYNDSPASVGIDGQCLNDGDSIRFEFESYDPSVDASTSWKTSKHG